MSFSFAVVRYFAQTGFIASTVLIIAGSVVLYVLFKRNDWL